MKVFISQSPERKTVEDLRREEQRIVAKLKERYGDDIEVVNALDKWNTPVGEGPLCILAKAIELLSAADVAVFVPGGSKQNYIEEVTAQTYGVSIVDYTDLFYDELPRYVVDNCNAWHEVRPLSDADIKSLKLHRTSKKHPVIAVSTGNLAVYYGQYIYWENLRPGVNFASMELCRRRGQ